MKPTRIPISAIALISFAVTVDAAVFERDWQTPGDGLLTYDDVHPREWLDLSVSRMDQFPVPWLQSAVAEIGPGGLFEGFKWAKRNDVISFAESAGIDTSTTNPFETNNEIPVNGLMELMSVTFQLNNITRSMGFIEEEDTVGRQFGAILLLYESTNTGNVTLAGLEISSSDDLLPLGTTGLMLYRAVPEPSVCWMISVAFIGLRLFWRGQRI